MVVLSKLLIRDTPPRVVLSFRTCVRFLLRHYYGFMISVVLKGQLWSLLARFTLPTLPDFIFYCLLFSINIFVAPNLCVSFVFTNSEYQN